MSCEGTATGFPGRREENVVWSHHEQFGFELSFDRKRDMDSHLVAVKVCVESRRDQRMDPDRLSFDENRFECLDTEAVKRRSSV